MAKGLTLALVAVIGLCIGIWWFAQGSSSPDGSELLNVSYDPTRELWRDLNDAFIADYRATTGQTLTIRQSHGGSSSQARAVIDGLNADVVTLALWSDTDAIRARGLIADGWDERLPHRSLPYLSTVVFVVRQGNPHGIRDWPDLLKPGVSVVTPNPKTSGNGKLSFLAAWGDVIRRGGTESEAREFVTQLYQRVPVLDTGARGCTATFAQKKIGDVHLTWENEARLESLESRGALEIVYPAHSIRAEPPVAWVDSNVDRKSTRAPAEAYLKFLYTKPGQEIIAKHFYRPIDNEVLMKHADRFPAIELFGIETLGTGWGGAQDKFFSEGGVFDAIWNARRR
jgi:sulfate transport system substrate-binding protein